MNLLSQRSKKSHKGQNGRVLVIGGSEEYSGAVILAAKAIAALRLGPDLVTVAAPEKVAWAVTMLSPDLITVKLKGSHISMKNAKPLLNAVEDADVVLAGPGISIKKETSAVMEKILPQIKKPKVIDAGALHICKVQDLRKAVFTPHKKEFETLLRNSGLKERDIRSSLHDNVVLLKGRTDRIISKDKEKENKTGNEGMTVGGTGDILAGLVAGFISQGHGLFDSALKAARLNGQLGDRLKEQLGYGFIASDFLKLIAETVHKS